MAIQCLQLQVEGIARGNHVQNVMHFNVDNNDDATPIALASELVNYWDSTILLEWQGIQSSAYAVRWLQARVVSVGGGNSYWKEYPIGSKPGTRGATIGVLQLAPIVKLFTSLAAGLQGRIFMPPPAEADVVDNVIQAGYINAVDDWVTEALSFSVDHDWNLAVLSRKLNQSASVTTTTISDILGSIGRRRKPL